MAILLYKTKIFKLRFESFTRSSDQAAEENMFGTTMIFKCFEKSVQIFFLKMMKGARGRV